MSSTTERPVTEAEVAALELQAKQWRSTWWGQSTLALCAAWRAQQAEVARLREELVRLTRQICSIQGRSDV